MQVSEKVSEILSKFEKARNRILDVYYMICNATNAHEYQSEEERIFMERIKKLHQQHPHRVLAEIRQRILVSQEGYHSSPFLSTERR